LAAETIRSKVTLANAKKACSHSYQRKFYGSAVTTRLLAIRSVRKKDT